MDWQAWTVEVVRRWYTKTGLALACLLLVVFLVGVFSRTDLGALAPWQWLVIGLAPVVVWSLWMYTRLPRVQRGRVGVAIALSYEDEGVGTQVRADFAGKLKNLGL
jgi:hypothetical protein